MLSSSDVDQASFAGGGSLDEPEPSLFTGALVDVLRSGRAGTSASGLVSIDDLFDAVTDQLRHAPQRQTPVKSAIRVSGRIPIAARPLGGTPQLATQKQRDARKPRTGLGRVPGWPELLAYYHDAVRAEMGWLPLLPVRGDDYVCLPGRERVLCGATDEDGCVPLPSDAEQLISAKARNDGVEWWVGWPAVVLFGEPGKRRSTVPHFAPLLMRQVEVATAGDSLRLRPLGPVVPHPGLAHARLDEEEAAALAATYQPTWHHGESGRMAEDAGHRCAMTSPCQQWRSCPLCPDLLSDRIDTATPLEGARNTAVLFGVTPAARNKGLLSELAKIADQPTAIAGTALACLFPQSAETPAAAAVAIVTPKAANPSQRAVLASAMTRQLTVATGPPGTGKSQLVVDAVATAVAAKQSVLVASTNNQAVNEVWERCQQIVPGLLIRTGNRDARALEAAGLQELLGAPQERRRETQEAAFRSANRQLVAVRSDLDEIASRERELLALGRARQAAERAGRSPRELSSTFGLGWGERARRLASAPWWAFGGLRRRRFLERLEMVAPAEQAQESCEALADLADVDERWQAARRAAQSTPSDEHLIRALDSAQQRVEESSRELVKGAVQDRAVEGQRQIADLLRAQATRLDWGEFRRALPFTRGWAATSLSAKRFPFGPKLFDLVIIDEASQCSIPSIVPLLFRARRALVSCNAKCLLRPATSYRIPRWT